VITRIAGCLLESEPEVVIDVAGIGLAVRVPRRDRERLPAPGQQVVLWTHLAVREDDWSLYGFTQREERELFRRLIAVGGIGPRLAVGMLGAVDVATLTGWIVGDDRRSLATLPGIGKRTAARLVTELADKLPPLAPGGDVVPPDGSGGTADPQQAVAEQLLVGMGMPPARARRLLEQVREHDPAVGGDPARWVRAALRLL